MVNTGYRRITVLAADRNVEMLLPSGVSVGELIPQILKHTHTGVKAAPQELTLTPVGGGSLALHETLADAQITDGSLIRLDRRDEIVRSPVVYDLADTSAELTADQASTVRFTKGRLLSTVLVLLLAVPLAFHLLPAPDSDSFLTWALAAAAVPLVAMAVIDHRWWATDIELTAISATLLALALFLAGPAPFTGWMIAHAWIASTLLTLALNHRAWKTALLIGIASITTAGLWYLGFTLDLSFQHLGLWMLTLSGVLVGLIPRIALILSGLSRVDDDLADGQRPYRSSVASRVMRAHAGMAVMMWLICFTMLTAVFLLGPTGDNPWITSLVLITMALVTLRSRHMPLVSEKTCMLGAAVIGGVFWAGLPFVSMPEWIMPGALGLLLVLILTQPLWRIPAHVSAGLRLGARRIETLLTLSIFPVLVGAFGLYARLIETFQG